MTSSVLSLLMLLVIVNVIGGALIWYLKHHPPGY
ncbi:hypothetical protein EDC35_102214 [Thiobaca trueperi]|uniref:Uncharacterized protein n=1 Tax=Thiobaca trueperi TaxID=127458 RepID=A0A4R3N6Z9_9GAMM|nr:hypothetical protein EDC35_102214 [Thiobaca trueperi]